MLRERLSEFTRFIDDSRKLLSDVARREFLRELPRAARASMLHTREVAPSTNREREVLRELFHAMRKSGMADTPDQFVWRLRFMGVPDKTIDAFVDIVTEFAIEECTADKAAR